MNIRRFVPAALAAAFLSTTAQAGFHVMQIEQFIGGVGGNSTAQAIQLRLRGGGQNIVSAARLRAWDSTGANPILLLDMTTNVSNAAGGATVLLGSATFNSLMSAVPGYVPDFTLASTVPNSYLSGGKITFEDDGGTIYWALAFGSYTGSNLGDFTNDGDGNFGAPTVAPPTGSRQGIRFTGAFSDPSTTNAANYALSPNPATVTNNAGASFSVVPEPGSAALLAAVVLGGVAFVRRRLS